MLGIGLRHTVVSHELQAGTETDDRDGEPPLEDPASDGSEASMETVPADERDALLTIAHGAVVTSGGISVQRGLMTATEFVLARALGPVAYGVYALAWRIAQILIRLVTFGSVPASSGTSPTRATITLASRASLESPTPLRSESAS